MASLLYDWSVHRPMPQWSQFDSFGSYNYFGQQDCVKGWGPHQSQDYMGQQQCGKGSREGFSSGGETATQQVRSRVPQHLAASSLLSLQRLKLLADAGAERRDLLGLEVALRDQRLLLSQERRLLFLVPRARPRALLH